MCGKPVVGEMVIGKRAKVEEMPSGCKGRELATFAAASVVSKSEKKKKNSLKGESNDEETGIRAVRTRCLCVPASLLFCYAQRLLFALLLGVECYCVVEQKHYRGDLLNSNNSKLRVLCEAHFSSDAHFFASFTCAFFFAFANAVNHILVCFLKSV